MGKIPDFARRSRENQKRPEEPANKEACMWNDETKEGVVFIGTGLLIVWLFSMAAQGIALLVILTLGLGLTFVFPGLLYLIEGISRPRRFAETFGMNPPSRVVRVGLDSLCVVAVTHVLAERAVLCAHLFKLENALLFKNLSVDDLERQRRRLAEVRKETKRAKTAFWAAHDLAREYRFSAGQSDSLGEHLPGGKFAVSTIA